MSDPIGVIEVINVNGEVSYTNLTANLVGNTGTSKTYVDGSLGMFVRNASLGTGHTFNNLTKAYDVPGYVVSGGCAAFNPDSNEQYHFGCFPSLVAVKSFGSNRIYILKTGTIKSAGVAINFAGNSNNIARLYVKINDKNDISLLINNIILNNGTQFYSYNTGLQIPVSIGDYIEFDISCGNWIESPPTNLTITSNIYIE